MALTQEQIKIMDQITGLTEKPVNNKAITLTDEQIQEMDRITGLSNYNTPQKDVEEDLRTQIINEDKEQAQQWLDKGEIKPFEMVERTAKYFNGSYDNVIPQKQTTPEMNAFGKAVTSFVDEKLPMVGNVFKKTKDFLNQNYDANANIEAGKARFEEQKRAYGVDNTDKTKRYEVTGYDRLGMPMYREIDLLKKIGFLEASRDSIYRGTSLGSFGEAFDNQKERNILKKIYNNEPIRQDELDFVNRRVKEEQEKIVRGYSTLGKIGEGAGYGIGLTSDMIIGSSLYTKLGGAVLSAKIGAKAQNAVQASKNFSYLAPYAKMAAESATTALMGGAAATVANPQRVYDEYQSRMLNNEMQITDTGIKIFEQSEEKPATAFFKSIEKVYTMYAVEMGLGTVMGAAAKAGGQTVGKYAMAPVTGKLFEKFPKLEKLLNQTTVEFAKKYEQMHNLPVIGKSTGWMKDSAHFDGFLEEMGEEALEDVINRVLGTNNEERSLEGFSRDIFKTPEEWLVISGCIAIQGGGLNILSRGMSATDFVLGNSMAQRGIETDKIKEVLTQASGEQKSQIVDELIKKGDLTLNIDNSEFNKQQARRELEEKVYNKLVNDGRINKDQAQANAILFGQFFENYVNSNESKKVFDEWFKKFDVRFNVPVNTVNNQNSINNEIFNNIKEQIQNLSAEENKTQIQPQFQSILNNKQLHFSQEKYQIDEEQKNIYNQYSALVEKVIENKKNHTENISMGTTPQALVDCGLSAIPMETSPAIIRKMKTKARHNVKTRTIKALPYLINNPVAVFKSNNNNSNSVIVLLNARDKNNLPVMLSIEKNNKKGVNEVNFITSGYGRKENFFKTLIKNNKLIKIQNRNIPDWLQEFLNSNDSVSENHKSVNTDTIENNNNIISNSGNVLNPSVKEHEENNNILFQSAKNNETKNSEQQEEQKLIAGFTYNEIIEKLSSIYEELSKSKISQKQAQKLIAKADAIENAIDVFENQSKYSDEQLQEHAYNIYNVMNNKELPDQFVYKDEITQKTFKELLEIHNKKKEQAEQEYYGYFSKENNKNYVTIMSNHNASTALHELGHLFLDGLNELSSVDKNAKTMLDEVNKRLGVVNGAYTREQLEKFAGSYEAYLYRGKAPNATLRNVFEEFKKWLKTVYKTASEIQNADISDEVQEMFDKMFSGDKYFEEKKQADELLKQTKELSKKGKNKSNLNYNELELTQTQKKHKEVSYQILSAATGKNIKYLKTIFETASNKQSFIKKREAIENEIANTDDKITVQGFSPEWSEFYNINDKEDANFKLAQQALDVIINKKYQSIEENINSKLDERANYFENAINEADREYKFLLRNFKTGNRNVALSAIYDWIDGLDSEIKQDYEDRFIFDAHKIERDEHENKFDKAKRKIINKALELKNKYALDKNDDFENYKELVKETMKNLNFLQPKDKARLTANILDISNVDMLISSIDNILDIAKTMEDIKYRKNLELEIHKELQTTKNTKKNGRTVGRYNYKTNKIFEKLREYDRLSVEKAQEELERNSKMATAEDEGLSFKEKLYNKFLSYKAKGRFFADTELMKEIYDEITKIKLAGKSAKSELELSEKLTEEKDIDELIDIVHDKKDAKITTKGYISWFGNLESTINAIFNKNIKERYASEILYAETQAQAFQYEQKKKFEKEAAAIYNLPVWNWDFKILQYLAEKHTYPEFRRKYNKETGELIKTKIEDRTLSKMDILVAFIYSKNEVLEMRLINQFGQKTLDNMFDELSEQDIKFANLMQRTAQSFYPMVNKAFIKKYGLDLPKVSCYFPSTPERGSEVDLYNEYSSKSLNNGFTKARANDETIPMDFHNPVTTLYSHIDGVAKFCFMSESTDRANLRFKNPDLKRAIINKYGEWAYKTLEQSLINVTYKKESGVFNGVWQIVSGMVNNWISGNVNFKPLTGIKQLTSVNNYAMDMPYLEWHTGFIKALMKPKETIDYIMNIPYIKARYGGNFSNEFLKQTVENSLFAASGKLKDLGALFIKMGDIGAIIFGGKPYIDYLINKKGMSEEQAIKQFILSTNRSQQSSAISSLSNFQVAMARNPFGALITAFRNSQQQYIRMCGDAVISVANGDMTKTQAAKIIFHFGFFQPFLFSLAGSGSLLRWALTGDDEDFWLDLKMSLTNLCTDSISFVNDLSTYVRQKMFTGKYTPQSSPLFGDIQKQIAKISKEDVTSKDWLESLSYVTLHVVMGINSDSIINSASGTGDIATGSQMKGTLKVIGMTDKRAKHITGED